MNALPTERPFRLIRPTARTAPPQQQAWRRLDARLQQVIERFLADLSQPYYLKELAAAVQLCPRQLGRLFQQEIHFTPLQYLKRLRLEKAAELLRTTDDGIKEICGQIGCEDISQFGAAFKRVFGRTPRQYRQQRMRPT